MIFNDWKLTQRLLIQSLHGGFRRRGYHSDKFDILGLLFSISA
jgi:hypothetical protein